MKKKKMTISLARNKGGPDQDGHGDGKNHNVSVTRAQIQFTCFCKERFIETQLLIHSVWSMATFFLQWER